MTYYTLPALPFSHDALAPYMSAETLDLHHGKHHQTYVTNMNNLIQGAPFEKMSLLEVVQQSTGALFNNAAQVWNHNFFWQSLSPQGGARTLSAPLREKLEKTYGAYQGFCDAFKKKALAQFGSGWCWLVETETGLDIVTTGNADVPFKSNPAIKPVIVCDVWEHAYYVDYRNRRADYVDTFLQHLVNFS